MGYFEVNLNPFYGKSYNIMSSKVSIVSWIVSKPLWNNVT